MDYIGSAANIVDKVGEIYSDYKTGKSVRLGNYKGSDNVKQLGHYSTATDTRLGIYHK